MGDRDTLAAEGNYCVPPGVLPYNGLYREAPPEKGTLSGFTFLKGWDFISWSIWKSREICHCSLQKNLTELTDEFYGCRKDKKTFWFIDLFIFKRLCINSS